MSSDKNLRKYERYKLEPYKNPYQDKLNKDDIYIELSLDEPIKGNILDIGLKGLCMVCRGLAAARINEITTLDNFFIKLFLEKNNFIIGAKKVWHNSTKDENGGTIFKAGIEFDIMASEDMLKLSSVLEKIRNRAH
ncbi:MAG: hypothetical protein GY754_06565 [bacterium]|nr:hypothetical protein [bacterium]